ncbi:MAG: CbiX/SirB N-terminal domain-containing protein [Verrucomicrobiota bacterium]
MNYQHAALIVAGHGSTENEDSSSPSYQHADEIRQRGIFAEVHEAFWKEEPHFRDVLRQVESDTVYIVPNFISEGYFTEAVLPREFGLDGAVTQFEDGKTVYYCAPVGIHESMTDVLYSRAVDIVKAQGLTQDDLKTSCLFIVGHGTSLNLNSTKVIYKQVEIIKQKGVFGDCQASFMEQEPFISDWRQLTDLKDVIVVPFFISDGLHSYEDIPVLLGISKNVREEGFSSFNEGDGRRLWYASAIGTEKMMVDVILHQVRDLDESIRRVSKVA